MSKRAKELFSLCCLLAAAPLAAADPRLFLEALAEASSGHPAVRAVWNDTLAAAEERKAADWLRYPTPSLVSQTPHSNPSHVAGLAVNRLVIEQPLYAGGRIDATIDAAQARQDSARARHGQAAQDQAIRLSNAWHEWVRQQARIGVLQEGEEAHRKLFEQIQRRVREGLSAQADLTLAAGRLNQARSDLAQARSALKVAQTQLAQLAGPQLPRFLEDGLRRWAERADYGLPPEEWMALALARDPQAGKLDADEQAAEAEVRIRRSQLYPTVNLRLEKSLSAEPNGLPANRILLTIQGQPGAGLSALNAVAAAQSRRLSLAESRRQFRQELEQAFEADRIEHLSARERMELSALLINATQEVTESYSRQFSAGRKSWLEVLNAVREATAAQLSLHDARAAWGQTWWRLRIRALGLQPAQPEPS